MRKIVKEVSKVVHRIYKKQKHVDSHRAAPTKIRRYADIEITK